MSLFPRGRLRSAILVVLVVVAITIPVVYVASLPPAASPGGIPIKHIVVLVMENHPYDNLFGTYCLYVGPHCPTAADGIPGATCVPYYPNNTTAGCIAPYPFTKSQLETGNPPHEWNASTQSLDNGRMDGFYAAEESGVLPFGYYDRSTVPVYWDLAQEYGLGDHTFSSALSYSLPNHWYLLAGKAPPTSENVTVLLRGWEAKHLYLNQSNATRTVQDLLNNSPSTTWKYYDKSLGSYEVAISYQYPEGAYSYWNPLAARAESYTSWYSSHFTQRSQFFNDSANGTLPDVSWIIPNATFSDHPPANLSDGQGFVASVVNSVEASPEWSSTAIFVTWDDYGGFYDHVAPPRIDSLGLSFRVPLLVISPYTPAGTVVHSELYFESLLHFIEWRFNLGCLTVRDCNAPLPLAFFDFNQAPRAPMFFPTSPLFASYPFSPYPPGLASPGILGNPAYAVNPARWYSGPIAANATVDELD
ncbi:MAG: hypothetical protein L3K18_00060 [Thermoplasmata archaeon]|nr:hypothetical protein [Thermoplasmata archaeon]